MGVRITGVGSYLPQTVITRQDWVNLYEDKSRYGDIPPDFFDIPDEVHHAGVEDTSSGMGATACLSAIKNAGLTPDDIELVLCFSVVPDQTYPKDGQTIVHMAGLRNAVALDIDLACASFQSLLKVGAAFINQGLHKRIALVASAHWVHRAIDKSQDYSPLGDGAAAVILEQDEKNSFIGICEKREEAFFDFVRMSCSGRTGKNEFIQFKFNDEFKAYVKGRATDVAKQLIAENGYQASDINWVICHQVGIKPMRGWCRSLGISEDKLLSTYMHTGNCMSSNMPLVLDHYINKEKKIRRGDLILMYALSSGFHSSALLWKY